MRRQGNGAEPPGGGSDGPGRLVARLATTLTRALLVLYPSEFRREVGAGLAIDVARRAAELAASGGSLRVVVWLPRLVASLLLNAAASWRTRLGSVAFSLLDLKLALRMLVKHPGLTLTGGLGIFVAIVLGLGFHALTSSRFYPIIPLDEGQRLVGLENWDTRTGREDRRALYDFLRWQAEMQSVEDITAFRLATHNLVADHGTVELVRVAEMTAAGFTLARVPPLMGRTLLAGDEAFDAPPVVVIGYDVWRTDFASDPAILGQELQLGSDAHTIVGVMPNGFGFPVDHRFWIPLQIAPQQVAPGEGPAVFIAARLAPGFELADARAELEVLGDRAAAAHPDTHSHLRPDALPYTYPFAGMNRSSPDAVGPGNLMMTLILVVVCVNVAILVYARTVTRRGEIAVRTALGARRARIVAQMFVEALVLCAGAAALGFLVVDQGLAWARAELESAGNGAFWSHYAMPASTPLYACGLALLAALITGAVPGLHATGRQARTTLAHLNIAGGARLGRTWTALLVAQVALAVALLPLAGAAAWHQSRDVWVPAFAADEILFAELSLGPPPVPGASDREAVAERSARFEILKRELSGRLEREGGIVDHAFTQGVPGAGVPARVVLESSARMTAEAPRLVERSTVDLGFFRPFDVAVLAGRDFVAADREGRGDEAVVVNRAFAEQLLADDRTLGRRVRYAVVNGSRIDPEEVSWLEIVGVVDNIVANPFDESMVAPRVYHLMPQAGLSEAALVARIAGADPMTLASRIRQLAAAMDPTLRVEVVVLEEIYRLARTGLAALAASLATALLSVLLLSAAGIYALMSFTVAQRRREIAIRTALGAPRRRVLGSIFRRAVRQISVGMLLGIVIALLVDSSSDGDVLQGSAVIALTTVVLIMGGVGLAAALGPARRGLRVEPSEALKGD